MISALAACSSSPEKNSGGDNNDLGILGDGGNDQIFGMPSLNDKPLGNEYENAPPEDDYFENEENDNPVVTVGGATPGSPAEGTSPNAPAEGTSPNAPGEGTVTAPSEGTLEETVISTEEASTEETTEPILPPAPTQDDLMKNPFISTAESKFSTFSADVDTASYAYFRKLVNMGCDWKTLKNNGSSFRTEEFINYFKYDVNAPKEGELFGVYTEMTPCPWNSDSMIFRMTLQAPSAPESAGNNLVFLIDVSGSMSSNDKLPLLKKAFSTLVASLTPKDTISIVTYSGKEAVVLEGCNGIESQKILDAINSLKASGSTNGEAGLTMAYQIAESYMIEGGNNRIIMASDGDLNVGIKTSSELKEYIEGKRDQGIYLSVLGFGMGNYRDDRMEALADNGNGVYYYIDGESEAEKVFGTDLPGTLYTVAGDVKLQIEFNKDIVESFRLIGYDNRVLSEEDFENDSKDAGEVGASHQVTVAYEIKLKTTDLDTGIDPEQDPINYMTFRVRYKNPGESFSRLNEYNIGSSIYRAEATEETRFILSVIETAALLRNKDYNGDITIQTIKAELERLDLSQGDMIEFRELIGKLAN